MYYSGAFGAAHQGSHAEVLAELVDHSLVVFGSDAERRRYGLHETIRQFAQEQLRGSDQEADALERHARYYSIPI